MVTQKEKTVETQIPQYSSIKITALGEIYFSKTELKFEYFNKNNNFAYLDNKTVSQTLENNRYSKFTEIIQEKYSKYCDTNIGDFLMLLKSNNDNFYKNLLNPYGDYEYCKFSIGDTKVMGKKGLYIYKLGSEVVYIGRCKDSFKKRINQGYGVIHPKNCYIDGQSTNCHINSLINKTGDSIELFLAFFTNDFEIEEYERKLIQEHKHKWNLALKD